MPPPAALTSNARQVLKSRYLRRDAGGRIIETPEQMFRRVAAAVAAAERRWGGAAAEAHWGDAFFRLMAGLDFLPNSPTLMNAGETNGQLSACFVLPVDDSLESIFTTLKHTALIHQSGGGTGFNFSRLRPQGDRAGGFGVSSGPLSFLRIFDLATEEVRQGGRRRGANMGILNADHPDIEAFLHAKADGRSLRNFNLSLGISDAFMTAVRQNGDWPLVNPRTGVTVRTLKAAALWKQLVEQAWQGGDPGLIFLDTINRHNPTPALGAITATNPCGEMPLLAYESCNLGSVNLSRMLKREGRTPAVDWERLAHTVAVAIRLLDDVIEVNHYLLPEIERMTKATRKIGLGVMGWAELLIGLGIPYASDEAVALAERLMAFIGERSREASAQLAGERGAFPAWEQSTYCPGTPLRHAVRTSIAPTGTISIIAGTSSSIEPLFALAFRRVGILEGRTQVEVNRFFRQRMRRAGLWSAALERHVRETGSLSGAAGIPDGWRDLFRTSLDIPWSFHVRHQVAFQKHTDSAVSKTINLPESATRQDVADAFRQAWRDGAKGITVYRCGSKAGQVLQRGGLLGRPC